MKCAEVVRLGTTYAPWRSEVGHSEKVSPQLSLKRLREGIWFAVRQRDTECAGRTEFFGLKRAVSCGSGDHGWRAKLDLGSREPFDDLHGSATLGTAIKSCSVFSRGGVFFGRWFWGCAQQLKAAAEEWCAGGWPGDDLGTYAFARSLRSFASCRNCGIVISYLLSREALARRRVAADN